MFIANTRYRQRISRERQFIWFKPFDSVFCPKDGGAYLAGFSNVVIGCSRCLFGTGITFDGILRVFFLVISSVLQDKLDVCKQWGLL